MSDRSPCTQKWSRKKSVTHYCHKQTFMRRFADDEYLCWLHRLRKAAGL